MNTLRNSLLFFLAIIILSAVAVPLQGQEMGEETATVEGQKEKKEEIPVSAENLADEAKFRNAMDFIRLARPQKALQELQEYLEIYSRGAHRDEAYRQIALIYCENFDYLKAVSAYRNLYQEYGGSESGIGAYFNMGMCYRKMGYREKARRVFEDIVRDYPASSYARQAETQIELVKIIAEQ